jgi:hypothetical protein
MAITLQKLINNCDLTILGLAQNGSSEKGKLVVFGWHKGCFTALTGVSWIFSRCGLFALIKRGRVVHFQDR